MITREFFLCVAENYSFIFTSICLNLKEIILKGTITWSTLACSRSAVGRSEKNGEGNNLPSPFFFARPSLRCAPLSERLEHDRSTLGQQTN